MKKIMLAAILLLTTQLSFGQQQISIDSLQANIGKQVKVCARYFGMKETENVTLINVGAAYPQSPLTIVIYEKDKNSFKQQVSKLEKERTVICVTGMVSEFKGKLQIVVENAEQLELMLD